VQKILDRRNFPPGQHGPTTRNPEPKSVYGKQLREKQRLRAQYNVSEKQLRTYFQKASRSTQPTGEALVATLESRLDAVIYRAGFARSIFAARQYAAHGHFEVNGRKTNIPSYQVSVGDVIKVRESAQSKTYFKDRAQLMQGAAKTPAWLKFTFTALSAEVVGNPAREDVEIPLNEQLIVEYYSR